MIIIIIIIAAVAAAVAAAVSSTRTCSLLVVAAARRGSVILISIFYSWLAIIFEYQITSHIRFEDAIRFNFQESQRTYRQF